MENRYLGDTIGAEGGAFDKGITRVKIGWCKFRDIVPSQWRFALTSKRQILFCMCT